MKKLAILALPLLLISCGEEPPPPAQINFVNEPAPAPKAQKPRRAQSDKALKKQSDKAPKKQTDKAPKKMTDKAPFKPIPSKFNKRLKIGQKAPSWKNLAGTDGKKHSLAGLKDKDFVVVIFSCNHCPVVVDYEDRYNKLYADYKDKGVALVAINVNNREDDKLPAMKKRAKAKGFKFPYLYDPSQRIAVAYGATVTPHVFVLNKARRVVYQGAFDNSRKPEKVTKHYLRNALDALTSGKALPVADTQQFGCSIKYEGRYKDMGKKKKRRNQAQKDKNRAAKKKDRKAKKKKPAKKKPSDKKDG